RADFFHRSGTRPARAAQPGQLGYCCGSTPKESPRERRGALVSALSLWTVRCRAYRPGGVKEFSSLELGVAGGNGLVQLERHAATFEQRYDLRIRTFGFDLGSGLPPSSDPRVGGPMSRTSARRRQADTL